MNLEQHHRRQDRIVTAVVGVVYGLGFAGAIDPAVEHAVTAALLVLASLGVLLSAVRWGARARRERREDRADELAGIAWRTRHMPDHPLTARDRAAGRAGLVRVGVS